MDKKMLQALLEKYEQAYDDLYNAGSTGDDKDIEQFSVIAAMFPDLLMQFNLERFDYISSDRECAAFARAFHAIVWDVMCAR